MKVFGSELDKYTVSSMTADIFIGTVQKYTRAKKLTEAMLGELIERVEVHQSEKIDGVHQQKLTIHYNCVGAIDIPEKLTLPDIIINTRKGVNISYTPYKAAT